MARTGRRGGADKSLTIIQSHPWDPGPVDRLIVISAALEAYQRWHSTGYAVGWDEPSRDDPRPGLDLVVDVCLLPNSGRVVAGASTSAAYDGSCWQYDDWHPLPPLALSDVLEAAELPVGKRLPATLTGSEAQRFVTALTALSANPPPVVEIEGGHRDRRMRERSAALRYRKLLGHNGRCEACGVNYGLLLDGAGSNVFDVHHLDPLGGRPGVEVHTALEDLVVLCANCHRLVHAGGRDGVPLTPDELAERLAQAGVPAEWP